MKQLSFRLDDLPLAGKDCYESRQAVVTMPVSKGADYPTLSIQFAVQLPQAAPADSWQAAIRDGARQVIQTMGVIGIGRLHYFHAGCGDAATHVCEEVTL